jgi:glycosyltransferase involved in cell wall biosynthesis
MIKDLHIIIFSRLQDFDGGRETWLNKFIPELAYRTGTSLKIFIYHFTDDETNPNSLIDICLDPSIAFEVIQLVTGGSLYRSFLRIVKFHYQVFTRVRNNRSNKSLVIGIGSFHEAIIPYLLTFSKKARPVAGVWLRSVLVKQLGVLTKGMRAKIMVKIEKVMLKKMDVLISNGWDTAIHYKTKNNLDSIIIPNALSLQLYKAIKPLLRNSSILRISFIGRLSEEKGLLSFLDSIKKFNENYPELIQNIEFEIVGSGPLNSDLINHDFKNLKYLGTLGNDMIPSYLGTIDCGVALTSSEEVGGSGLSHGFLELLAAGRITIAWHNSIFTQIGDQESICYVAENDTQGLANIYCDILVNRDYYLAIALKGKEIAQEFSIEKHVSAFIQKVLDKTDI